MVTSPGGVPTLERMDGSVRVLLVSAGASPHALVAELERLGVEITPCAFADAEEHLETDPPDLVALAGALGAIELANMLDDLEDAPRMVIVAERKELAKLRGLNREVVVSLFAMETTEKVVGQRIESLARRAARRRDHKAAEQVPVSRTSLGLPSAADVGQLELKTGDPPPKSRGPLMRDPGPPSSDKHPGAEAEPEPPAVRLSAESGKAVTPGISPEPERGAEREPISEAFQEIAAAPEPERAAPTSDATKEVAVATETEKPGGEPNSAATTEADGAPEAQSGKAQLTPEDSPARKGLLPPAAALPPVALKPPLPDRRLPTRSAKEEAEQSIMVIDENLLESILPDPPEGNISEISLLSMISVIPEPEDAPVSQPPTLPPAAKVQGYSLSDLGLSASPGELDIGDAESALENLDSAKLEITQELVQHAQREMSSSTPFPGVHEEDEAAFLEETAVMPHPKTERPPKGGAVVGAPVGAQVGDAVGKKGGGGKAFGLLAAVSVVVGGLYAASSGKPAGGARDDLAPEESEAAQTFEDPAGDDEPAETAHRVDKPTLPPQPESVSDVGAEGTPTAANMPETAVPAPELGPAIPATMTSSALDNPFKRQDTKAPSCEELLGSAAPVKGPDPVSEASAAWQKARSAIVGGKLEDAHRHMCEAVSINPDSAALEGLAAHYLNLGSYSEALRWAKKVEAVRPGQTEIGTLMGDVYAMRGEVDKARDTWLKLLNIGPDQSARLGPISKDYSVEAGRHLRRGDLVRAEIFFRRAVILDPENQSGLIGLAKVYHRLEMPAYARAFCDMSLKLSDVIPEVHVLLGELSLAEGNKEEARQRFERALAVRPDFFPAQRGLAQVK